MHLDTLDFGRRISWSSLSCRRGVEAGGLDEMLEDSVILSFIVLQSPWFIGIRMASWLMHFLQLGTSRV